MMTLAVAAALTVPSLTAAAAPAADGTGATSPKDSTEAGASTGAATVDKTTGDWTVTNDDDDVAAATDKATDINVWAKVIDGSTKVYKVDVAWGAMKFEYTNGGLWNTTTHTYAGGQAAAWTESYVDGANNKLTITNHSNDAIDAGLAFAFDNNQKFNADENGDDAVRGNFFATNDNAIAAAKFLNKAAMAGLPTITLKDNKNVVNNLRIHTADTYGKIAGAAVADNQAAGAREAEAYFAFSGTPDAGKGAELNNFKKVGVITVTIAPMADKTDFEFPAGT